LRGLDMRNLPNGETSDLQLVRVKLSTHVFNKAQPMSRNLRSPIGNIGMWNQSNISSVCTNGWG
jgi:hypothetical protein